MIALMALSSTFVSCSDSDDDTDNAEQAKAIAGTYNGVNVEKTTSGYTLSLGEFESEAESSTGTPTPITGVSLEGTVATDGTAEITVAFKPGSMPMPITAVFTGSSKSSAQ